MVNKHTCDYCGKTMKRHLFCSASCKVRFHRGDKVKTEIPEAFNTKEEVVRKVYSYNGEKCTKVKSKPITNPEQSEFSETKKEGYHLIPYLGKYVKD